MAIQPYILLCTVGTSLKGNLKKWRTQEMNDSKEIGDYTAEDWHTAVQYISGLDLHDRLCGAEINSIQALIDEGHVTPTEIHLFHSDTNEGRDIACMLKRVYTQHGLHGHRLQLQVIDGLRDSDPKGFRTKGLRNLVRQLCHYIREYGSEACAINATGGYKAQIAIAVMIGQALGVPVYYKHERFEQHSIISFPPLPIALDESVWRNNINFFHEAAEDFVPAARYEDELDEVLESLVEREKQEGEEFLTLSPAGHILHEKCQGYPVDEVAHLRAANRQASPHLGEGHLADKQSEIRSYLQRVTEGNPFVTRCRLFYANKDLSQKNHFRLSRGNVTGVYSDGSFTAKFVVETTAEAENQKPLAVSKLNQWLENS